ncbi:Hypothetical protein MVR_LOCUS107 [uncultured virus]|nr:Hypothetical protein MVR_LOCUS107 [uncultured virus]
MLSLLFQSVWNIIQLSIVGLIIVLGIRHFDVRPKPKYTPPPELSQLLQPQRIFITLMASSFTYSLPTRLNIDMIQRGLKGNPNHRKLQHTLIRSKHKGNIIGLRVVIRTEGKQSGQSASTHGKQSGQSASTHGKAVFKVSTKGVVNVACSSYPTFVEANHRFMEILAAQHMAITALDLRTLDCKVTASSSYLFNAPLLDRQAIESFPSTLPLFIQDCTRYPELSRIDMELADGLGSIRCTIKANNDIYLTVTTNPEHQASILKTIVDHLCEPPRPLVCDE